MNTQFGHITVLVLVHLVLLGVGFQVVCWGFSNFFLLSSPSYSTLILSSRSTTNLRQAWAALHLLKTPEARPSRLPHRLIRNLAAECHQQDTKPFRWLLMQRLLKEVKGKLKKTSKTLNWLWLLPAWSRTQLSALMMMRRKIPLPLQPPAVCLPQRSSGGRPMVCACTFCKSTTIIWCYSVQFVSPLSLHSWNIDFSLWGRGAGSSSSHKKLHLAGSEPCREHPHVSSPQPLYNYW